MKGLILKRNGNSLFYCGSDTCCIKEIKPMDDQEAYLLANIFDGIINTYIECSLEDESLFNKKDEILQRFLKVVGV